MFMPFLDDDLKFCISRHAQKQVTIGSNLKSITLVGTHILNWTDKKLETSLHRQLMCIESICEKKVVCHDNDKKQNTFKGRLFYAVIPNQKTKLTTYYFLSANTDEARSVARGLPLFIRDYFKLKPTFSADLMKLQNAWKVNGIFLKELSSLQKKRTKKKKLPTSLTQLLQSKKSISRRHTKQQCVKKTTMLSPLILDLQRMTKLRPRQHLQLMMISPISQERRENQK